MSKKPLNVLKVCYTAYFTYGTLNMALKNKDMKFVLTLCYNLNISLHNSSFFISIYRCKHYFQQEKKNVIYSPIYFTFVSVITSKYGFLKNYVKIRVTP